MSIELRNERKKKKPHFRNHNSHKIKRATNAYRRPKGIQNKMRLHHRGYSRVISVGYRSPVDSHGLTREGLVPVLVHHVNDLEGLESGKHGVVLGSGLGQRKRVQLAEEAAKQKLTIVNCKDVASYKASVEKDLAERKQKRTALSKKRTEAEKKAAKAEKKEEAKPEPEDKKVAEKKELDKVLTQKK